MLLLTLSAAAPPAPPVTAVAVPATEDQRSVLQLDMQTRQLQAQQALKQSQTLFEEQQAAARLSRANRTTALIGLGIAFIVFLVGSGLLAMFLTQRMGNVPPAQGGSDSQPAVSLGTMPLGMPEGSIRALLSIFVIVFGFAIVVLQDTLGLKSAEAITGFIGAVIAFYFATRSEAVARESADKAVTAQADAKAANERADRAMEEARRASDSTAGVHAELRETAVTAARAAIVAAAGAGVETVDGSDASAEKLRDARTALENMRRVLSVVAAIKAGPGNFQQASELLATVETGLATIAPLLSGKHDPATLAKAAEDTAALIKQILPQEPVVSTIADALSNVAKLLASTDGSFAGTKLGGALAALGPAGLVGGIIGFGADLIADAVKFDRLKAALLERPFDLDLIQVENLSGNAALLVLDYAPTIDKALSDGQPPAPASDIAAGLRKAPPDELKPLVARFDSDAALTAAIEEYRTAIITVNALGALPPTLPAPAAAGEDKPVGADVLIAAAHAARQLPSTADAIDRLMAVLEALGSLPPGERSDLLKERFAAALGLSPTLDAAVAEVNNADAAAAAAVEVDAG